jgi:hypothetical protein
MAGCHLPLYKSYQHYIRAENINKAKIIIEEYIEESGADNILVDKMKEVKNANIVLQ